MKKKTPTVINRYSAMLRALQRRGEPINPDIIESKEVARSSEVGEDTLLPLNQALDVFKVPLGYIPAVDACRELAEESPIFRPIIRKLVRTVTEAPTTIVFENPAEGQAPEAAEVIEELLKRIQWDDKKDSFVEALLNEGGLSAEIVTDSVPSKVISLEYRPHDSIIRNTENGKFVDPKVAYIQKNRAGEHIADFRLWQLADVNLSESVFHDRGVPHLQCARQLLEYFDQMLEGLMQKWALESGSIEHVNLEDARKWSEVKEFQTKQRQALKAHPSQLVRRIYTKGKVNIERILADSKSTAADTTAISFILDLIFLAAGIPKEIMGFRSMVSIKDVLEVGTDNYFQQLQHIEAKLFKALRHVIDTELILHKITPAYVPYTIKGGRFEAVRQVTIHRDAITHGAVSINDIRQASNLARYTNPLWNVPGLYIDAFMARSIAREMGLEPPSDGYEQMGIGSEGGEESAVEGGGDVDESGDVDKAANNDTVTYAGHTQAAQMVFDKYFEQEKETEAHRDAMLLQRAIAESQGINA